MIKSPGNAASLPDLELGKAAEHLVVADLSLQGHRAYLTDQGLPYDVVVDLDDSLVRIQVKATRELRAVPQRAAFTPGYIFHVRRAGKGGRRRYDGTEFDLLALVALDVRMIAYMPFGDELKQTVILRPPGAVPAANATRQENIDQFPFFGAIEKWKASKEATLESTGRTFAQMKSERSDGSGMSDTNESRPAKRRAPKSSRTSARRTADGPS